jgi:hypothetical protein
MLTKTSYAEVHSLLRVLEKRTAGGAADREDWTPSQTGLARVTSAYDGTTAWILNSPDVIGEFHTVGAKALQVL